MKKNSSFIKLEKLEKLEVSNLKKLERQLIQFIKQNGKRIAKEARAEIRKEARAEAKAEAIRIAEVEAKAEAKKEKERDGRTTRSGSWEAIYSLIDGTEKGFRKLFPELFRNINTFLKTKAMDRITIDYPYDFTRNWKISFDCGNLRGLDQIQDLAMNVIGKLLKNKIFSETGEYRGKEYRFATIVHIYIKEVIYDMYIVRRMAVLQDNPNIKAKVDMLDGATHYGALSNEVMEQIEAPTYRNIDEMEFVDIKGEFKFKTLLEENEKEIDTLTDKEQRFIGMLSDGLTSKNWKDFGISFHYYRTQKKSLVMKGIIKENAHINKAVKNYAANK